MMIKISTVMYVLISNSNINSNYTNRKKQQNKYLNYMSTNGFYKT